MDTNARFLHKVTKQAPDICWCWNGGTTSYGYGVFWTGHKTVYAHRYMWELLNGDIPEQLIICHKCDNPRCVNPSHLFLGTKRDNVVDMYSKKRGRLCKILPSKIKTKIPRMSKEESRDYHRKRILSLYAQGGYCGL